MKRDLTDSINAILLHQRYWIWHVCIFVGWFVLVFLCHLIPFLGIGFYMPRIGVWFIYLVFIFSGAYLWNLVPLYNRRERVARLNRDSNSYYWVEVTNSWRQLEYFGYIKNTLIRPTPPVPRDEIELGKMFKYTEEPSPVYQM
jgi:hypothetical protein